MFQAFNLLPTLTAAENIVLPMTLAGNEPDKAWVDAVVATVGLGDRLRHHPERAVRRSATARRRRPGAGLEAAGSSPTSRPATSTAAPARDPGVHAHAVDAFGQTIVMVTHDPVAASYADTVIFLADGRIVDSMAARRRNESSTG